MEEKQSDRSKSVIKGFRLACIYVLIYRKQFTPTQYILIAKTDYFGSDIYNLHYIKF